VKDMFGNDIDKGLELENHRGDHEYLAKLFPDNKLEYAEVAVGSYHVIRSIHGVTREPSYYVYSPESYRKYKLWTPTN
jgi:hypothetical protein